MERKLLTRIERREFAKLIVTGGQEGTLLDRALLMIDRVESAAKALADALPKCRAGNYGSPFGCTKTATFVCLDAAGEEALRCDEHKFTGGMCGDDEPTSTVWAAAYVALVAELER